MNLKSISTFILTAVFLSGYAQEKSADTVIVPLAESSKIVFTVGDRTDLDILRYYDFQKLFEDILTKLAEKEGLLTDSTEHAMQVPDDRRDPALGSNDERDPELAEGEDGDSDIDDDGDRSCDAKWDNSRRGRIGQTWQSYNLDLGMNNYLAGDQFPDGSELYAVRPWGSWYIGVNSVQRTRLGKNVFVEWGLGVSWYNFKFQEDNVLLTKDESGVHFNADVQNVEYIKSKLSATFINVSLVPVLDFRDRMQKPRVWDGHQDGFRFGIGPYVGYRVASKSKLVFESDGDRKREKDRDSYYLNNLRYGFRLQLGIRSTDLFINYDLNDLFAADRGPELHAVSFGLVF